MKMNVICPESTADEQTEESWIYALSRDLSEKIKECDALREELNKCKEERKRLFDKINEEREKYDAAIKHKSVPVEITLSKDGKKREYCGSCGRYSNYSNTFCPCCGAIQKRKGR